MANWQNPYDPKPGDSFAIFCSLEKELLIFCADFCSTHWNMSASHFSITKDSGGKKKFKTRKILFLFALITIIVCAIIVPIAVVYSQQPIDDDVDNGERVSCFPLIGKKHVIHFM